MRVIRSSALVAVRGVDRFTPDPGSTAPRRRRQVLGITSTPLRHTTCMCTNHTADGRTACLSETEDRRASSTKRPSASHVTATASQVTSRHVTSTLSRHVHALSSRPRSLVTSTASLSSPHVNRLSLVTSTVSLSSRQPSLSRHVNRLSRHVNRLSLVTSTVSLSSRQPSLSLSGQRPRYVRTTASLTLRRLGVSHPKETNTNKHNSDDAYRSAPSSSLPLSLSARSQLPAPSRHNREGVFLFHRLSSGGV